ncbi:MAG: hypothetical protein WD492_03520, partial [Alkalispirochaeta sp.]
AATVTSRPAPVRMDFGGGWTDTPPYTLREGGRVCNVAIDLNGQPPIQVFCRPVAEPEIRLHSIDLGDGERVTSFTALEERGDSCVSLDLPKPTTQERRSPMCSARSAAAWK